MASIFRSIRAAALLLFIPLAGFFSSLRWAFTNADFDAHTSIELDRLSHEFHPDDPAERSRHMSFVDRSRSHDLFAGDGFCYG